MVQICESRIIEYRNYFTRKAITKKDAIKIENWKFVTHNNLYLITTEKVDSLLI